MGAADEDEEDEEMDESGHVLRVALSREQAAAFAIHATRLVEAGRPPCPCARCRWTPPGTTAHAPMGTGRR